MKTIIAADLFCGAGGTSTGLHLAALDLGYHLKLLAINHWNIAISTHSTNHPWADHLCENLDNVDPRKVVPGGQLDLLVASPECTHHSRARGGKPISDQSRASAWHVLRWAEALYIENILIENVPEFMDWGPIDRDNQPVNRLKGKTFLAFLEALRSLGYNVDFRVLNAADYGDPTTRKRLFIMARKEKQVRWPDPAYSKDGGKDLFSKTQQWRPAREIIDWSVPGESIFNRKRPLSPNTMRRIQAGLRKFSGLPFIVGQQSGNSPRSVESPIPTITTTSRGIGLAEPFLIVLNGTSESAIPGTAKSLDEPVPTITGVPHVGLVEPFLVQYHGASYPGGERVRSVDDPMPTVATNNQFGLCEPFIIGVGGPTAQGRPQSVDDPLGTVLAENHRALVEPFIIQMDMGGRLQSVDEPLNTVTSADARALVEPFIVAVNHGKDQSRTYSVDAPMPTVTSVDAWGLIEPFLVKYNGTGGAMPIDEPLDTVTAKDRFGLVIPLADGKRALLDIRFRMLQPHELARAMSFPDDYEFAGNREAKVKQIGNAVPVMTAKALCEALLS